MSEELLERPDEFEDTPQGWASRWSMEIAAARKELKKYQQLGDRIIKRFLDERGGRDGDETRLNLFTSDVRTVRAVMYGKTPSVDVGRRFADANDDEARVGGELLQRLLNTDIERGSDGYRSSLRHALDDFLLPGMGVARVAYVADFETVEEVAPQIDEFGTEVAPGIPATEQKARDEQGRILEDVETRYINWRDFLYSPARTFQELRWMAFRAQLSRTELKKKWPKHGDKIPLNSSQSGSERDARKNDPWRRADVWEIWDGEQKCVWFYVEGYSQVLGGPDGADTDANGSVDDPLGLENFWPIPEPMMANVTTSAWVPRPDYVIAQDQYEFIEHVSTKISQLERAIAVKGVYNKKNIGVQRLVSEAQNNELIPIENWEVFVSGGGVKGSVDWLPLEQIVAALDKLRDIRSEAISRLNQTTGIADIIRGGQGTEQSTATESAIKARFGSVRLQNLQEEFARFASDLQSLKAEIISKHFDPETIIQRSNIQYMPQQDQQIAQAAVQLVKDRLFMYRIQVKPEAVSLTDFSQLQQERSQAMQGLAMFLQMAGPLAQQMPGATPGLLQMLQWAMAGYRGSSQIEGVLDDMIGKAKQAALQQQMQPPQPPPPDPKVIAAQIKAKGDVQKTVASTHGRLMEIAAETHADILGKHIDHGMNLDQQQAQHEQTMQQQEAQARRDASQSIDELLSNR